MLIKNAEQACNISKAIKHLLAIVEDKATRVTNIYIQNHNSGTQITLSDEYNQLVITMAISQLKSSLAILYQEYADLNAQADDDFQPSVSLIPNDELEF